MTITLTQRGAILISAPTTEQYAASTYAKEAGGNVHRWEPAERESAVARDYDLRMLGLAAADGQPDARGAALIDVLRAEGAVSRPAEDDGHAGTLWRAVDADDRSRRGSV